MSHNKRNKCYGNEMKRKDFGVLKKREWWNIEFLILKIKSFRYRMK